jgi:AcrR family transcriptional regulator
MAKTSSRKARTGPTQSKPSQGRRSQEERTAESTQRLIDAAIALIAEKGFNKTTTAEIGERAGYSRSMVQFRYGTKEAFLESLLREEYETRLLATEPGPDTSGLDRVLAQIDLLRDQTAENPGLMRGFFVLCWEATGPLESLRGWLADWLERYRETTIESIRAGIDDGSISAEIDPEPEAGALIASCIGDAFMWTAAPDLIDFVEAIQGTRDHVKARLAASE